MNQTKKDCYSVTEITYRIKDTLEQHFGTVRVEGEISNFRPSSAGHLYFTLKDENALISVVMFKYRATQVTFTPTDGKLVVVEGSVSVYPKRGSYQIICDTMNPSGEGNILAMLEERKRKLAEEGLFDSARKKKLPLFPSRVAVVTSPTGAAIRDILRVLRRRNSGLNLVILPAAVQGEEAASAIAQQIRRANTFTLGDVIIVGRGGGSLEDLLPFSDEMVVRAIAESEIPVISAVGHEIDVSLSDLASDVHAPTPSAAAEMVSSSREDLLKSVVEMKQSIITAISGKIERIQLLLKQFRPEYLEKNVQLLIQPQFMRLDDAKEQMIQGLTHRITESKHAVALLTGTLESNSPLLILEKGYALVTNRETGRRIRSARQTAPGETLHVRFAKDSLNAVVEDINDEEL